jgi:hypothetical protein
MPNESHGHKWGKNQPVSHQQISSLKRTCPLEQSLKALEVAQNPLHNYHTYSCQPKPPVYVSTMADTTSGDQGHQVSCQCNYITFHTPLKQPLRLACCHCTACQKQSASAFGSSAFYPADAFVANLPQEVKDRLQLFTHPTDSGNTMHCYFCPKCGVRLYQSAYKPDGTQIPMVAVKAGCVEGLEWKNPLHIWTKSSVVAIPDGVEQYEKGFPLK